MIKVYEHPDFHIVGHLESILNTNEIPTTLRNLNISGLIGEIPQVEAFPELWILNNDQEKKARSLIKDFITPVAESGNQLPWTCSKCKEEVPASFEICWNCQSHKPE